MTSFPNLYGSTEEEPSSCTHHLMACWKRCLSQAFDMNSNGSPLKRFSNSRILVRLTFIGFFFLTCQEQHCVDGFLAPPFFHQPATPSPLLWSSLTDTAEFSIIDAEAASTNWELDCYSRPVVVNGKKLWEVLITDSAGSFRFRKELPSNQVNSKTLRTVVDEFMEKVETKPSTIRFFRGQMFNMIQIALSELPVTSKPSRCTFALASWLEELHTNVYPEMEGYNANMVGSSAPSFLNVRTPIKLPDSLRGEQYAFVALPVQEFLPGGGVTPETIGVGRLCQLPEQIPGDEFIQGLVILSARAPALATWLSGTEIVAVQADLRKRILTMETDIDTQYLMAKLNDEQRVEAAVFEEGKDKLNGLHFVSVQKSEDDDPEGFWLLRELPNGI